MVTVSGTYVVYASIVHPMCNGQRSSWSPCHLHNALPCLKFALLEHGRVSDQIHKLPPFSPFRKNKNETVRVAVCAVSI